MKQLKIFMKNPETQEWEEEPFIGSYSFEYPNEVILKQYMWECENNEWYQFASYTRYTLGKVYDGFFKVDFA